MKALTDYIHRQGPQGGHLHLARPATCGGHGAAISMRSGRPAFRRMGIRFPQIRLVLLRERRRRQRPRRNCKNPIELSGRICCSRPRHGLQLLPVRHGRRLELGQGVGGHSWRTAGDLGGSSRTFPTAAVPRRFRPLRPQRLHKYGGPGGWNDPDYLLLGYFSNWTARAPTPLSPERTIRPRLALVAGGRAR